MWECLSDMVPWLSGLFKEPLTSRTAVHLQWGRSTLSLLEDNPSLYSVTWVNGNHYKPKGKLDNQVFPCLVDTKPHQSWWAHRDEIKTTLADTALDWESHIVELRTTLSCLLSCFKRDFLFCVQFYNDLTKSVYSLYSHSLFFKDSWSP